MSHDQNPGIRLSFIGPAGMTRTNPGERFDGDCTPDRRT